MSWSGLKETSSFFLSKGSEEPWLSRGSSRKWHSDSLEFTACWLPETETKNSVRIRVYGVMKGYVTRKVICNSDLWWPGNPVSTKLYTAHFGLVLLHDQEFGESAESKPNRFS